MQGTSMAAPHVSGAVALLVSAAPGLGGHVAAIEQALTANAEPKTTTQGCGGDGPDDVPNNVWGWGILDAQAAVEAVTGVLAGTVTDAASAQPISGATVSVAQAGRPTALTDPTGSYSLTLAAETYTVTAQASGYLPQTIANVSVITGQITMQDFALDLLPPPTAAFTTNSPICLAEPLIVTNTSTNAEAWSWQFGDGQGSTAWEPTHVYSAAGEYTVTLTVSNTVASISASATVQVNPLPVAAFHWAVNDLTVIFYNDSRDADAYLWDFGDGLTATVPAPSHTYALSATYPVTLTAYNGCGQDSLSREVRTGPKPPWRIYLPLLMKP